MEYGKLFQDKTKYNRESLGGERLKWSNKPELYKEYIDNEKISLPDIKHIYSDKNIYELLQQRKSVRKYLEKEITLEQLSYLLWCSTGISRLNFNFAFRTSPSAGALYPVETYIHTNFVTGIKNGIFHYNIKSNSLELVKHGDFKKQIALACLSQYMLTKASVIFIWSGIFKRITWKYKDRGYRYVYIEAGHIAENLALSAHSINLATCQIGAFFDDELNEILALDGKEESVIYLSTVGFPA